MKLSLQIIPVKTYHIDYDTPLLCGGKVMEQYLNF